MDISKKIFTVKEHSPRLWTRWIEFEEELGAEELISAGSFSSESFSKKTVAVVGTRKPSSYGIFFVREFIKAIKEMGWNVASGGALGIDYEVHKAAFANEIPTQAWLVGPLANPSPRSNHELFASMIARENSGILVPKSLEPTEGRGPRRADWLCRNRWLVAASDALVVVEGTLKSGTWSTAAFASRVGIPTFALPGPIFSPQSEGTNLMISRGYAHLIPSVRLLVKALVAELGGNPYNKRRAMAKNGPGQGGVLSDQSHGSLQIHHKLLEFLRNQVSPFRGLGVGEAWSLADKTPYSGSEILRGLEFLVAQGELTKAGNCFERRGTLL